ncbi:hypothetical protein KVT40_000166 [Elsinoe batatas]|uniref:Uncharacterized protein n=1 Tax=Elsinoe batatas TaxID=2601811 RepID=A0A8K0LAV9_9PEZI|nr:hypothetical protein KVT40_000166 [Elsinoe batatas]
MSMAEGKQQGAPLLFRQADLKEAVKVGGFAGAAGFTVGSVAGLLRNASPGLFGLASGIQCFGVGTTFWASRSAVMAAWYQDAKLATPCQRTYASTIAGGFTGVVMAWLTRGKRNVLPGAIMFSIFGASGQGLYNLLDATNSRIVDEGREKQGILRWIAKQKWSPFSILSDAEYETILKEKILKLEVEIALIDDRIDALRRKADAGGLTGTSNDEPK